jgi:lysophospholipase L1-like esterase
MDRPGRELNFHINMEGAALQHCVACRMQNRNFFGEKTVSERLTLSYKVTNTPYESTIMHPRNRLLFQSILILASVVGICQRDADRLRAAEAAAPARPVQAKYTSFNGETVDRFVWPGRHVALQTVRKDLDPAVMTKLCNTFDKVYDYYHDATGREPARRKLYEGRVTITEIRNTCGAGCGYLGATGIELMPDCFQELYQGVLKHDEIDQALPYEFGRNFWFYSRQLAPRPGAYADSVITGYAVFMRFTAVEAAGAKIGPFRSRSGKEFRAEVERLVDLYVADPSLNWENTLRRGAAPANPMGLGATDLFASFCFRLCRDHGGAKYAARLWQAVQQRPPARSTQDAVDSFVVAASVAAGDDLAPLFAKTWRWPVSDAAKRETTRFSHSPAGSAVLPSPSNGGSIIVLSASGGSLHTAEIRGDYENPKQVFGRGANYRLVGDAKFGWRTGEIIGDINLNGHAFVMETGGGNRTVFRGSITGKGQVDWHGGGVPQAAPSILGGDKPNTFQGVFTLSRGVLDLDKPAGVDAISGDLVIGGKGNALVKLGQPRQINAAAKVTLEGPGVSGLDLQGHDQQLAALVLKSHAVIQMGDKPAALLVGDSSTRPWDLTKTLTIRGYKPGKDKLAFGGDPRGLSAAQLARIGFASPRGLPEGLYNTAIGRDGQLSPHVPVAAVDPPFDVSPAATARREKLYNVPGLAEFSGKSSPLKDGATIDFFGDSITWLNGFISRIHEAIAKGEGTRGKRIKLVNHGINGGGVLQVRDGAKEAGFPGNSAQAPFAKLIAADKAGLAVVFIGINDVWWRKTAPDVFEKAMRDLLASAQANHTRLVLATLSVHGELPDGKNGDDPKIEQYAEITRKVARDTGTTLVDLRSAYIAYLRNHNAQLRVDGTLYSTPTGVLTYDGVHPSSAGVELLANLISDGIVRALADAPPR